MVTYSKSEVDEIFKTESFINNYNDYIYKNNEINNFIDFINKIKLNKKYFRLEINKNNFKYKNKNKFVGDDTLSIKEVNGLLNKLTDKNLLIIQDKIKSKLENKDYLTELIIENILEKCIVHTTYIPIYIELIQYLYKGVNTLIMNLADKIYNDINNKLITEDSDYLIMCEKNKKLDKLIGYSILITELEKSNIISGKLHSNLENFILILSECDQDEEKYKCVQCLYNILKSYYGDCVLPEGYNQKLKILIQNEQSKKIKFRMMDIIDRK